jgi:hypothetical protein
VYKPLIEGANTTGLPNNSLKLTRRAALLGQLAWPANEEHNPGVIDRYRRAA